MIKKIKPKHIYELGPDKGFKVQYKIFKYSFYSFFLVFMIRLISFIFITFYVYQYFV